MDADDRDLEDYVFGHSLSTICQRVRKTLQMAVDASPFSYFKAGQPCVLFLFVGLTVLTHGLQTKNSTERVLLVASGFSSILYECDEI